MLLGSARTDTVGADIQQLQSWRMNSPFVQTILVSTIVFLCSGLNGTVLGLGAGGSHPAMIPTVDRINTAGVTVTAVLALFAGSVNNQIGPRSTLLLACSGYPTYIAALWLLDQNQCRWFGYVAAIWHGASAALLYSSAVYVVSTYSPEHRRGRYLASLSISTATGNIVGAAIILGITSTSSSKTSHVPPAVYITIITLQCLSLIFAAFIKNPANIRRNDGRAIAVFKNLTWKEELKALPKTLFTPQLLLLAVGITASLVPWSFISSVNGFYFSGRTRALVNLCVSISTALGALLTAFLCDAQSLGRRRRRALLGGVVNLVLVISTWSGAFYLLTSSKFATDRSLKPSHVDWTASPRSTFSSPLAILVALGFSYSCHQGYQVWLCTTFSNAPKTLGRTSGYIEAMRAAGLATAFGVDSNSVRFLTEAEAYFILLVVGLVGSLAGAARYTKDSRYGEEDGVIMPADFEQNAYGNQRNEKMPPVIDVEERLPTSSAKAAELEVEDFSRKDPQ